MKTKEPFDNAGPREIWDAYDRFFNVIKDVTLVRGKSIPEGMFHLVCHILVKHTDGSWLLMLRDPKRHLGGMWEATAGGSALKGETPEICAKRELMEETGINAVKIREVDRRAVPKRRTWYITFLCETDVEKDSIRLQPGETVDYQWVTFDQMMSMKDNEIIPGTEELKSILSGTGLL